MKAYNDLIDRILTNGRDTKDRTKVGTWSVFGENIEFNLAEGFPIITSRHIDYRQAIGELVSFLQGATTKQEFEANGCNYWSTTAEVNGSLGPIYGAQWLDFNGVDQLSNLVHSLGMDPYSRRHILTTWNPSDLHKMCLPPCPIMAQFEVNDKNELSCMVYVRSSDVCLGLPYDIVVYAALTHLLAQQFDYKLGWLKFTFGNAHIYNNHIMTAIKMIKTEPPKVCAKLTINSLTTVHSALNNDFKVRDYIYNIGKFSFALNL